MKKIFVPLTLIGLAAILFSSCSNSSKLAFTKRHYRSGIFVDHIGKIYTTTNPAVAGVPLKPPVRIISGVAAQTESRIADNKVLPAPQLGQVDENVITPKKMQVAIPLIIYGNSNCISPVAKSTKANSDVTTSLEQGHHESDNISVPYIVIVICAIFIPPLGVGLMYGLNSYFWIDLILTLIFFFPRDAIRFDSGFNVIE